MVRTSDWSGAAIRWDCWDSRAVRAGALRDHAGEAGLQSSSPTIIAEIVTQTDDVGYGQAIVVIRAAAD